jgi:hypothetical protein
MRLDLIIYYSMSTKLCSNYGFLQHNSCSIGSNTLGLNPDLWNISNQSLKLVHLSTQPKGPPDQHERKVKPAVNACTSGRVAQAGSSSN